MAAAMTKEERMGSAPIGQLMFQLALPAVAAQFINMLYNVVDRIYIGHIPGIGATALTGVGVCSPILMLVSAFAAFAGQGGAPLASIKLGQGDREGAEQILGSSVTMLAALSVLLTVLFQVGKRPFLYAFGASDASIGYALDYIGIYLWGTVFVQFALGLNTFISAQGQSTVAMLSVLIGAVLNLVLDPLLIFGLGLGVKGAALATIFSQAISAAWVLRFLTGPKSGLHIRRANLRPSGKVMARIAGLGIAPFIMQSTESLVSITLNSGLQHFGGDLYVGTITILQSVMQMFMLPMQGISQGSAVHHRAAGRVNEQSAWLHAGDHLGADQPLRLSSGRHMKAYDVALGHHLFQAPVPDAQLQGLLLLGAAVCDDLAAKRPGQHRHTQANGTGAHNAEGLAGQLKAHQPCLGAAMACRPIAGGNAPGQPQNQPKHQLRHRRGGISGAVAHQNAPLPAHLHGDVIHAGERHADHLQAAARLHHLSRQRRVGHH